MTRFWTCTVSLIALSLSTSAQAATLRGNMGGPAGYGQLALQPNDDDFSSVQTSPFVINFFGYSGSSFFVNNNGSISFGSGISSFTPTLFNGHASAPLIAPFWADVDTRCGNCGAVYLGSRSSNSFTVTWNNVGYFAEHSNKLNNFQLTLTATPGNTGDFDIEFRYDRLEWTTGDASGGSQGLGGVPAQAGFDAGDGQHFYSLPGSFSSTGALNFANITNVNNGQPGEYRFSIRNGTVLGDGSSPAAPIQPTPTGFGHYSFTFDILPNQRIYIDPIVAVGYDYLVAAGGPNILSVLLPDLGDSDGYAVYLLSDLLHPFASYVGARGNPFLVDFSGLGGVRGFRVAGINPALGLDPANTAAFVAGLTFDVTGPTSVSMTQTALPFDTSGPSVPEPATWAMLLSGFGLIGTALRRRRAAGWAPATA